MKRLMTALPILLLIVLLCACAAATPVRVAPADAQVPETLTVSSFLRELLDNKAVLWKQLQDKYAGTEFAGNFISINAPDYIIALLPMYDTLTLTAPDGNRREGQLILSGIPAWSEAEGRLLRFGFTYTYAEDTKAYKKGAVEKASGELDFAKNTLLYENTVEEGGKEVARTVIEIVKDGGGYAYQYLYAGDNEESVSAVFCTLTKDSFTALCASKKDGMDFSYGSIRSGKATLEDMSEGFAVYLAAAATKDDANIVKK